VDIAFAGRGLDAFTYRLDPALPVRQFRLAMNVRGGDQFDYEDGVVPANRVTTDEDQVSLVWELPSLQSGVPVGVRLPSERTYDTLLLTMVRRSVVPFVFFFAAIVLLANFVTARLQFYEAYLLAAVYGFFYVLLAYLAAFVHFYVAYGVAQVVIGFLVFVHLRRILGRPAAPFILAAYGSLLLIPTLAVLLEGYTGLIYTLEILGALIAATQLSAAPRFRDLIASFATHPAPEEESHAV
jgi:hypothetical protein